MKTTILGLGILAAMICGEIFIPEARYHEFHDRFHETLTFLATGGLLYAKDRGSNSLSDDSDEN